MLNVGCGRHAHPEWVNLDCVALVPGVVVHDISKGLPFTDHSFDVVYHSHVLEHLRYSDATAFITECLRVTVPGGILRVVVPDLEGICRLYLENLASAERGDEEAARRYDWIVLELLDQMVRDHGGGRMGDYWRSNLVPAESFVIERMGGEYLRFREWWLSQPEAGLLPVASSTPEAEEEGRFRQSGEVHRWMYDRYSLGKLLNECGFIDAKVRAANESLIPDFNRYLLDIELDGSTRKPDSLFMEMVKPRSD
jgi:predicted SAM-dependent methyltransferase